LLPQQIAAVDTRLPDREAIARRYEDGLRSDLIRVPVQIPGCKNARHLFVMHVPPEVRDDALVILSKFKIGCAVNYRSVPTLSYYSKKYGYTERSFPVSFDWGGGTITLPLYPSLSVEQQQHVIRVVLAEIVPMVEYSQMAVPVRARG